MKLGRGTAALCLAFVVLTLVATVGVNEGWAADQAGSLTPAQEALAVKLEGELIAPCCWVQTVDLHQSEAADQIKAQIRMMLAQGKGEDEVLDAFVAQYGEKILASPRVRGFNAVVYGLPLVAFFVAAGVVAVLVVRWRRRPEPVAATAPVAPDSPADEALRARLDDELSRFDT